MNFPKTEIKKKIIKGQASNFDYQSYKIISTDKELKQRFVHNIA